MPYQMLSRGQVDIAHHRCNTDENVVYDQRSNKINTQHYTCTFELPPNTPARLHDITSQLAA